LCFSVISGSLSVIFGILQLPAYCKLVVMFMFIPTSQTLWMTYCLIRYTIHGKKLIVKYWIFNCSDLLQTVPNLHIQQKLTCKNNINLITWIHFNKQSENLYIYRTFQMDRSVTPHWYIVHLFQKYMQRRGVGDSKVLPVSLPNLNSQSSLLIHKVVVRKNPPPPPTTIPTKANSGLAYNTKSLPSSNLTK
jgi:hypothetical protein